MSARHLTEDEARAEATRSIARRFYDGALDAINRTIEPAERRQLIDALERPGPEYVIVDEAAGTAEVRR